MKKLILSAALLMGLLACNKEDDAQAGTPNNSGVLGSWQLKAVYMDPGDGSGSFEPVTSNKQLIFKSDGTVISNGAICDMVGKTNAPTNGTYNLSDSTIVANGCFTTWDIHFKVQDQTLDVYYPCIEACVARYTR